MVLNYIWIAFFLTAFVIAAVRLLFFGDVSVFPAIMNSTFSTARTAFEISIGLTGVLSLWLGIMKIGERGGVVNVLARLLGPLFAKLFPAIPKGHPVVGNIFMNLSANMLGLDNAATPLGLKAMEGLQELNPKKDTATDPMIMFLVLNTSGLTIIPVSILVYRAQLGAAQPTDVFVPILIATFCSTLAGIVVTSLYQRINLFNRTVLLTLGLLCVGMAALVWGFARLDGPMMNVVGTTTANVLLFLVIIAFLLAGIRRRVNVYEAFIEGAREGFSTAVRIIPYLVAMLVAIGVFRASGAMDWLVDGCKWLVGLCGGDGRTRTAPDINYGTGGLLTGRYMISSTWNAPRAAFVAEGDFFEGTGIDGVFLPMHKAFQFIGLKPMESFMANDVLKNPTHEADFKRFVETVKKNFSAI